MIRDKGRGYSIQGKMTEKIKNFTDLIAWQEGHKLVLMIYKSTDKFPKKEVYSLTNQMRRAAVSITSNIAEGFSRKGKKEKARFYCIAKGSLTELQNQLIISKDINYMSKEKFHTIAEQTIQASKLISGLIKSQSPIYSPLHTKP